MKWIFAIFLCSFFSLTALATITVTVNANTVSRILESGTTTYLFAGSAGSCSSPNADLVCDSCAQITSLCTVDRVACNNRSIHDSLKLYLTYQVDVVPANATVLVKIGTTQIQIVSSNSSPLPLTAKTDLFVKIPWSDISALSTSAVTLCSSSASSSCGAGSFSGVLKVGISTNGTDFVAGSEKDFNVEYRGVDASSGAYTSNSLTDFHTDCDNPANAGGKNNEGFCAFSVFPGDTKVYIKDLAIPRDSAGLATTPLLAKEIKWAGARIYYASGLTNFCGLAPASAAFQDLAVSDRTSGTVGSLSSNKVTGLTNGTKYFFMMASVDDAYNVQFFSNPAALASGGYLDEAVHAATPSEVVGLLDGKKCFIATAAFGSEIDPHVETLRKFRNQFLLTSGAGRSFVRFYYMISPELAKAIEHRPWLRAAVRTVLWPIVGLAEVSVASGLNAMAMILFVLILFFLARSFFIWRQRRQVKI